MKNYKFAIVRILGNENPPRDVLGARLKALEFTLKNEPYFPDTIKLFLLNRFVDLPFQKQLEDLLLEHRVRYLELPLHWDKLKIMQQSKASNEAFNLEVIGINSARNMAIDYGHVFATNAIVLDGDCIFDQEGWNQFKQTTEEHPSQYYSLPMARIPFEHYGQKLNTFLEESQLVFREDSSLRFNENILFGDRDKLDLLFRLGHDQTPLTGHLKIEGDQTRLAGYILHLYTGKTTTENYWDIRGVERKESLRCLFDKVRAIAKG
jgi:hypothetical protein